MKPKYLYRPSDNERWTLQSNGLYTMDSSQMVEPYLQTYERLIKVGFTMIPTKNPDPICFGRIEEGKSISCGRGRAPTGPKPTITVVGQKPAPATSELDWTEFDRMVFRAQEEKRLNEIKANKALSEQEQIEFGLCLQPHKEGFAAAVIDQFSQLDQSRHRERMRFKAALEKAEKKLGEYHEAYFDEIYNNEEIEKTWAVIGNYNRKHLELHEAVREKIREFRDS